MTYTKFNRNNLNIKKLIDRKNKISIDKDHIPINQRPDNFSEERFKVIEEIVEKIKHAKEQNRSVILTFGAHLIKNGMSPTLIALMEEGWVTHLATNGAGIIHDWEFAYQGKSSEDVKENISHGQFGIWDETGYYINLALIVGAYEGLGYGESIGKMIYNDGLKIPTTSHLMFNSLRNPSASIDLLEVIHKHKVKSGFMCIPHPWKKYSVQSKAYELKIPFTGHPMIGHDIIYNHPMNHGAAIGRTALTDFLYYTESVSNLNSGVYISIGSAVMSPMIFEKAFSMCQNVMIQKNKRIEDHLIVVVDIAKTDWDWQKNGEPPMSDSAYYLRYCKTFNRMGGDMQYLTADNRDFLLALYQGLKKC